MSSPDPISSFADTCESFDRLVHGLSRLPPHLRAEALASHVAHVYAGGLRLPEGGSASEAPDAGPWPEDWPGLGAADRASPPATVLLRGLWSDLDRGTRAIDRAAWWRTTFTLRWGALAVAALERLQVEIMEVRTGSTPERPPERSTAPPLPSIVPAPPQRIPSGRARPRPQTGRAVLGLRFSPEADGLRVGAVHPNGPAAGMLQPGELVTHVDGVPLSGRPDEAVAAALEGAPGQTRRFRVLGEDGPRQVEIVGVLAEDLAGAPVDLDLVVLDRDQADAMLLSLAEAGFGIQPSADQEGVVRVRGPASATAALRIALREGEAQGWWEVLQHP